MADSAKFKNLPKALGGSVTYDVGPTTVGRFDVYFEQGSPPERQRAYVSALSMLDQFLSRFPALQPLGCPVLVQRHSRAKNQNAEFTNHTGLVVDGSLTVSGTSIHHTFLHELGHMWWMYEMDADSRRAFYDLIKGPPTRWPSELPTHYPTPKQQAIECFAEWFARLLHPYVVGSYETHNGAVVWDSSAPALSYEEFHGVGGPDLTLVTSEA